MTKRMEQTQNAKMVQLALFREYGFQPCLKDIKILNTRDFDEFPGHVEALYTVIKGHFYNRNFISLTACVVIVIILLLTLRIIAALQFTDRKCSLFAGSSLATPAAYIKRKCAEPA